MARRSALVALVATALMAAPSGATAATLIGDYQLQGTGASSGPGPTLIEIGAGGNTFVTDNVMGVSRQVLAFPLHSGVQMAPAGLGGSDPAYSVVTTFRFDAVDGFRRTLDSSNGVSDMGFYIEGGRARYVGPGLESASVVFANNVYATLAITSMPSPATTKMYVNGSPVLVAFETEPVVADTLRFFKDEEGVNGNEDSAGAVSCIRVFSGVLTDAEIAAIGANPRCGAPATGGGGGTPPPGGGTPSNEFSFGKVKKNKRKGTAKLTVNVPGAGELDLAKTKKVKADDESAEDAGKEKLSIKPKGKAKKKLNKKSKAKVKAEVTFTPDGGSPNTEDKKIKLVKR